MKIPVGIIMEKMRRERRKRDGGGAPHTSDPLDEMLESPTNAQREKEREKVIVIEL